MLISVFAFTIRTAAAANAAISEHAIGRLNATTKRMSGYAAAVAAGVVLFGVVVFGLFLPATAAAQQNVIAATEQSASTPATDGVGHAVVANRDRNSTTALTSHSPWLAPVGHRQPRRADVPQAEVSSAPQHHQQRLGQELHRQLKICRC